MKKINIILILVAMLSLVCLGAVLVMEGNGTESKKSELEQYQNGYIENTGRNKDIMVTVREQIAQEPEDIYDLSFQERVRTLLDELISGQTFDEDMPLVAYNPFRTNAQSLYVYFETSQPYTVSYSVHIPEKKIPDFGGNAVPVSKDNATTHEFQIVGILPEELNMITLRLTDANGLTIIRRFYYQNNHTVAATELFLTAEDGTKQIQNEDGSSQIVPASTQTRSDGLFAAFQKENELAPFVRLYDNNGVQRAEIPLRTYGAKRLLLQDGKMYIKISEREIVALNRLGQAVQVFTSSEYLFGEDCVLDKNQDILVIASDKWQTSVRDCILRIDHLTGEITKLVDLGDLMPEYKKQCEPQDGILDWIGLNSIDWEEGNQILLTSETTGLLIKLRRLYNSPRISYLIGDVTKWEESVYRDLFLRVDNEFEMHSGVAFATMEEYDKIRETRQYIDLLNCNRDAEYGKKEERVSYLYRYLVDEAEKGVRLMGVVTLSEAQEDGSIQWYQEHLITNGDQKAEFFEYDKEFQLITKFIYKEPKVAYTEDELEYIEDHPLPDGTVLFLRVMKYDFYDYYFEEQPSLPVPTEAESTGS